MRLILLAFLLLSFSFVAGCTEIADELNATPIPLTDVPASVMELAKQELPDVNFTQAYKFKSKGEDVFEVRGKTDQGKVKEVEISASGNVLKIE